MRRVPGSVRTDAVTATVACLSDLHANLEALTAAIAAAEGRHASAVLAAGDIVGGGPDPEGVIRVLRGRAIPAVCGNVDRKVIASGHRDRGRDVGRSSKKANYAWTAKRLAKDDLRWLRSLPERRQLKIAGTDVLLVHGSPLGDADYVYPSITAGGLAAKLDGTRPDVLVCGHSHVPFVRFVAGVLVVNCGSSGRPVDGDPRGSFALLGLRKGHRPRARIVRFAYDVAAVTRRIEELGTPGTIAEEFRLGVKGKGA